MSSEFKRVLFRLEPDEDDWPPVAAETLWVSVCTLGYVVENIPFYVRGIASGDIVSAVESDGFLEFNQVIERSGHGTVRILVNNVDDVSSVRAHLLGLGAESEVSNIDTLFAVDIPPDADVNAILEYLRRGEKLEVFAYEEGLKFW